MGVPSFSGRGGGGGGGGGGQDRARGRHLTAAYTLSTFGRFNQWGGWCCPLSTDSTSGGVLSAFGRFNQWGGAVRFRPIQPVGRGGGALRFRPIQSMRCLRSRQIQPVDGGCCPLSANSASGGAHVVNRGGGGGAPFSPEGGGPWPPLGTPMVQYIYTHARKWLW